MPMAAALVTSAKWFASNLLILIGLKSPGCAFATDELLGS